MPRSRIALAGFVVAVVSGILASPAAAQGSGFVYALRHYPGIALYGYSSDAATGALTPLPGFPIQVAVSQSGWNPNETLAYDPAFNRLYAVDDAGHKLRAFALDRLTGALAELPFSPVAVSISARCVTVSADGSVLAVANENEVTTVKVGPTTMTVAPGSPFVVPGSGTAEVWACALSRDGAYFYMGGNLGGPSDREIAGFAVAADTAALTSLPGSPFDSGVSFPRAYQTDAAGRLFAAAGRQALVFTTSAGVPTAVTGSPFVNGTGNGRSGLLHPSGFYLTALTDAISVSRISGSGAATRLTAVPGSPFATGGTSDIWGGVAVVDGSGTLVIGATTDQLTTFRFNANTGAMTALMAQAVGGRIAGLAFVPGPLTVSGNLTFGNVPVGTTATRTMTIGNTGDAPLTVSSITYPPGFGGNWSSGTIASGQSQAVTVTFAPGDAIIYSGTITVDVSQMVGTNRIAASGHGGITASDFDGDTKADMTVFRPSTGNWHVLKSQGSYTTSATFSWGLSSDTIVPGDYDGDGTIDPAVYRASTGGWHILMSSTNYTTSLNVSWGLGTDVPVPADYDGDGKADPAIYRPSTGGWHILMSTTSYTTSLNFSWGLSTDVPLPGDYDGDGKADPTVFRPSTGSWYVLKSSTNYATSLSVSWGLSTDVPVPADYDGDGTIDPAVYRPSTGGWHILMSSTSYTTSLTFSWGLSTDVPVPGDFDGDGKTDPAIYRPSTGLWAILQSSTNYTTSITVSWGTSTDTPILRRP